MGSQMILSYPRNIMVTWQLMLHLCATLYTVSESAKVLAQLQYKLEYPSN